MEVKAQRVPPCVSQSESLSTAFRWKACVHILSAVAYYWSSHVASIPSFLYGHSIASAAQMYKRLQ